MVCTIETFTDNRREKSIFLRQAGAVGLILIDPSIKDVGFQFVIPGTLIGQEEAEELQAYMISEKWVFQALYAKNICQWKNGKAPK